MALNAQTIYALGNAIGDRVGAQEIANAVANPGTSGSVPSSAGAVTIGSTSTDVTTIVGLFREQATNTITAFATGGQGSATALTGNINRISVCATAGDSAKLPTAAAGSQVIVINDGAAAAQIFGAGTDTINSIATATGVPLPAGAVAIFFATTTGNWRGVMLSPPVLASTAIATVGAGIITAAGMIGGLVTRSGSVAAYSDATDTAVNIMAALPVGKAGATLEFEIKNTVAFPETITAGVGVTLAGDVVVPGLSVGRFLLVVNSVTAVTITGLGNYPIGGSAGLPATLDNTVTTGTGTMVSGAMEGAAFVTLTASAQAAITLTTRTAAQIQANVPNWQTGQTYWLRIINKNTGVLTTAGGANVTMTSTIPPNSFADYTVTFATSTTITTNQVSVAPNAAATQPAAKFTSINVTTGTLASGDASGAEFVSLTSTNATPGAQAMRTVAQVLADFPGLVVGSSYVLRIANSGAGTFTLATDGSAQFTMTGTMTIPVNTYTDFVVTINSATTGTVQAVASGPAKTPLPSSKFSTINVTTGTLAAGNASGAAEVFLESTNAIPGSQAMRTPAQVLADAPSLAVGQSYTLRVMNSGAGTFTLATDAGTGFTMTGTMTIPTTTWRDFLVTISTATTGIVQALGQGTYT